MGGLRKLRRKAAGYDVAPLRHREASEAEENLPGRVLDVARPVLENARNETSLKGMIGFAILCWDITLESEETQDESLRKAARSLARDFEEDPEIVSGLEVMGKLLIERKKALFPEDRRMILDYEFAGEGDSLQFHVTAISEAPLHHPVRNADAVIKYSPPEAE